MESELPTARHCAASSSRHQHRTASPCDPSSGGTVGAGGRRKTRRGGRRSRRNSTPSLPREPLATRVVSAEELLLEMQDGTENSSKPTPIVLRCRETVEQYEQNFERWLGLRSEKVQSDRDEERRLRLRFAELRVKAHSASTDSRTSRVRSRSRPRSRSHAHPVSALVAKETSPQRHRSISRRRRSVSRPGNADDAVMDRQPPSAMGRDRSELLATRVVSLEEFLLADRGRASDNSPRHGERLRPIPVLLRSNETEAEYNRNFERWLAGKNETLATLRADPQSERLFRHWFAEARARDRRGISSARSGHSRSRPRSPVRTRKRTATDAGGSRSRSRPSSPVRTRKRSATDGAERHQPSQNAPSEKRPRNDTDLKTNRPAGGCCSSKNKHGGDLLDADACCCWSCVRTWAKTMSRRMLQMEEREMQTTRRIEQLEEETRRLRRQVAESESRYTADADSVQLPEAPRAKADSCASSSTTDTESAEKDPPRSLSSPTKEGPATIDLTEDSPASGSHEHTLATIQCVDAATGRSQVDTEATEPRATTAPERETADPIERSLAAEYVRVHKQITLNETAMEDALVYVKAMMEVDQGNAAEHHTQIMELCVSINEAKARRESALAALIAHEWLGRKEELERLVRTAATEQCDSRHEQFLSICLKLELKEEGILALGGKLKKRLQWMRAADIPSHLQIEELREVSVQLAAEQSMRTNLKRQKREACLGFLKTSEAIHQVVVKTLVDAEKTQASGCSSAQAAVKLKFEVASLTKVQ